MPICKNKWGSKKINMDLNVEIPNSKLSFALKEIVDSLDLSVSYQVNSVTVNPIDTEVGIFEEYCGGFGGKIEIHNSDGDLVSGFSVGLDDIDVEFVKEEIEIQIGRM